MSKQKHDHRITAPDLKRRKGATPIVCLTAGHVSLSQYEMAPSHTRTQRHGCLKSCVFARPRLKPIHTGKYARRKGPRHLPLGIVNRREPRSAATSGSAPIQSSAPNHLSHAMVAL